MVVAWLSWRPTRASHPISHAFKFRSNAVEQQYQRHVQRLRVIVAAAYFAFAALLNAVHAASFVGAVRQAMPIPFWCFLAMAVLATLALLVLLASPALRHRVVMLHAGVVLVCLLVSCYLSLALAEQWLATSVWRLEQKLEPEAVDEVASLLSIVYGNQGRTTMAGSSQFHLTSLSFMGYNHTTIPTWVIFLLTFILITTFNPHRATAYIGLFSCELFLSIIPFLALCICVEVLQRSNFYAQQELKRELEVSQMAETMLNNTVKTALADAVANIQEYLAADTPGGTSLLSETLSGLARGMRCCWQRQAFLALVSETYEPHFQPVNVAALGEELLAGRTATGDFADGQVLLDPLLCHLMLENAIGQALQYGHREGPDVRVKISLESVCRTAVAHSATQVLFEVSFLSDDEGWDLHNDSFLLRGTLPAQPMTQRHLRMAAEAHGMTTRWFREQDRITFQAVCVAQVVQAPRRGSVTLPKQLLDAFPSNLTFYIIDDSAPARRLLASCLTRTAAPAVVHSFGATPQDVHQFVAAASQDGDIVICDQHLDYGDQHYLGTDLVRALRDRGFQGLLCMRSADMGEHDRLLYYSCGAHCAFGKEELCKDVVDHIKAAYVELKGLHRSLSPGTVSLVDTITPEVPRNSRGITIVGWDSL
eukprot:EG_transcript_4468